MPESPPRRTSRAGVAGLLLVLLLAALGFRCVTRGAVSPEGDGGVAAGGPLGGAGARGDAGAGGDAGSGRGTAEPSTGGPDAPGSGAGAPTRRPRAARPVAPDPTVPPVVPRPASADGSGPPEGSGPASPWGRFTLVGGHDASQTAEQFGDSVDIDGDVAVIGAPGYRAGIVECGAAYVYARGEDRVWKLVRRIDSPRPDMRGFAECVRVSGNRIAVFGGVAVGVNEPVFRSDPHPVPY